MSHETKGDCPACGKLLDRASGANTEEGPRPGDFSFCFYCVAMLIFTEGLHLRVATEKDTERLDTDHKLALARVRAGILRSKRGP